MRSNCWAQSWISCFSRRAERAAGLVRRERWHENSPSIGAYGPTWCSVSGSRTQVPARFWATYVTPYFLPALRIRPVPHIGSYAGNRQKDAFAQCLARCPDIVLFQRLSATAPWGSSSLGGARGFIDLDDVEHVRFIREITQPPHWRSKPLMYLQVPPLWWDERAAIVRSDTAFVCSEHDRQYLRRTMRVRNVEVMPNAVARVDDGPLTTEPNVLFIGNYRYGPNVVAAEYLIGDVWPRVARISPRARLLIAGLHSEDLPSFRNPARGVEFLGFITDLTALYRRTRVMCCPIQSGAGTRVKILEAASHGVPVVSTPPRRRRARFRGGFRYRAPGRRRRTGGGVRRSPVGR